ncbi:barstar family protein [uncultured Enterococcus sp.]|uniref:barstar family protein n=1 Tax=uncultured Enterococcus sp. TaxID=167972 RepID=UPI002AA85466|nr:barstar family protein [uncultured Enterococcus sp.]
MEELRKKKAVIDVGNIETAQQLQILLKESFDFPDFYGKNWNAFWDAITGLVMLPEVVLFENWKSLEQSLPKEASYLEEILNRYTNENPEADWKAVVKYE